ncbi:putative membrane protein YadS, partial [Aminobacter aganoensis]|nr:putative membrane protein YadS [Aminobacter aganoensis]
MTGNELMNTAAATQRFNGLPSVVQTWWPGLAVTGAVAIAAQFLSDHYGAPAMLMALLLG